MDDGATHRITLGHEPPLGEWMPNDLLELPDKYGDLEGIWVITKVEGEFLFIKPWIPDYAPADE